MHRLSILSTLVIAPLTLLLAGSPVFGASLGVYDSAKLFSGDAISQAEQIIHQINQKHHKDVRVDTFPEIPSDMRGLYEQQGKERFYTGWASQLAKREAVDGILILITREPGHLQVWLGNDTQQRFFSLDDRSQLDAKLATAFKQNQYDDGLLQGVEFIQQQMDANAPATGSRGSAPPMGGFPESGTHPPYFPSSPHTEFHFGGIACLIVGVILFIVLIRAVFGRAGGGSYGRPGGYYPPQGGYPPAGGYPMSGYPPQGGYGYGGGGSGFGHGFLGGLLGGAIGGYAADKWMGQGQAPGGGFVPPASGGGADFGSGVDTSGTSSGADFGSSGPSGGADFGSGGGGADFGGGGGGSDFGGGGGDSGGSSGSDF